MPTTAFHAFTIGRDIAISIVQAFPTPGAILNSIDLGLLEDCEYDPIHDLKKSIPINNGGIPVGRDTHGGWQGSLQFARGSSVGEQLELMNQEYFYQGGGTILWDISFTILAPFSSDGNIVTIASPGSAEWLFPNSNLWMTKGGRFAGDDKVNQAWAFFCPRMTAGPNVPSSVANLAALQAFFATQVAKFGV